MMPFFTNLEYWKNRYKNVNESKEKLVGYINFNKEKYNEINEIFKSLLLEKIIVNSNKKYLKFKQEIKFPINLVDLGVGVAGRWIDFLSKDLFNGNVQYFGYDIMPEAIENLKTTYKKENYHFYVINEDGILQNLPNEINFIWTHEVLQHVIDDNLMYFYFEQLSKNFKGIGLITENVFDHPGREYIKFRKPFEYENMFKKFDIKYELILTYDKGIKEPHNTWLIWKGI